MTRPQLGRSAQAKRKRGSVKLRVAGADRFYPLEDVVDIPLRSALDTSEGTVSVTTTKRRGGQVQEASLRGGTFTVRQTPSPATLDAAPADRRGLKRMRRPRPSAYQR